MLPTSQLFHPEFPRLKMTIVQHGIMFHDFHDGDCAPNSSGSISQKDLEKVILNFGRKRILSPDQWISRLSKGNLPLGAICLTFDDGLKTQFNLALPVLEAYNLRAFWFINSAPLDGVIQTLDVYRRFRYNCFSTVDEYYALFFNRVSRFSANSFQTPNFADFLKAYQSEFPFYTLNDIKYRYLRDRILPREEYESVVGKLIEESGQSVKALASNIWLDTFEISKLSTLGHEIGLHSYTHPTNLGTLGRELQNDEYTLNYRSLKPLVKNIRSAAYPCGSYSLDTFEIFRDLKIEVAFTSSMTRRFQGSKSWMKNLQMVREDIANIKF